MENWEPFHPPSFIARQPILDKDVRVAGYELLFRSGVENAFGETDGAAATSSLVSYALFIRGLNSITGGKRAFINFNRDSLVGEVIPLLPPESLVVEVLEEVTPDEEVLRRLAHLRKKGYILALDDFDGLDMKNPFLDYVQVVKVDFQEVPPERREGIAASLRDRKLTLLAEKVERFEDYDQARRMGYALFQGFFFCRPSMVQRESLPESKVNLMLLLREIHRPEIDLDRVEEIVRHDVSLSYRLLHFVNSAYFGRRSEATTVRQAVIFLGSKQLRRWGTLLACSGLGVDRPAELLSVALMRARFGELLAPLMGLEERSEELFVTGLFSVLDALLSMPMEAVLEDLSLSEEVESALLGRPCNLHQVLELVQRFERGDWSGLDPLLEGFRLDEKTLSPLYVQAIESSREMLGAAAAPKE